MAQAAAKTGTAATESNLYATLIAYFRKRGFTAARAQVAAAAFLGNFKIESGFDPNAYNPGENAHGYAQWEGGRWSGAHGLQSYASSHHLGATSDQAERGYLLYELDHGYSSVVDALRGTSNIDSAAQIVQSRFEGSTPDSLGARQSAARSILDQIRSGRPLTGGPLAKNTPAKIGAAAAGSSGAAGFGSGAAGFNPLGPLSDVGSSVLTFVGNMLWVLAGVVMIIVGFVIIAKSAGVDVHGLDNTPAQPAQDAGKSAAARAAAVMA